MTTYTYDAAGNRLTQTDARNITATYTYDALNRLTTIAYPTTSLNVTFQYDQADGTTGCTGSFPKGRLTRMIDNSGTTTYCYDRRGNPVSKQWKVAVNLIFTTQYAYTRGDRRERVTYPDGIDVGYAYDAAGRVVSVEQSSKPILTDVTYLPFGPARQITFAGGATQTFAFDQNYWTEGVTGTALDLDFDLDATGNIVATHDPSPANARSYTYDPLARLTGIDDGNAALIEAYTYDGTGNRLTKQTNTGTQTYGYPPNSHRLTSIDAQSRSYDAIGSLTARGSDTLIYDDRQRLSGYGANTTYRYNGRGERVRKTDGTSGTTYYHYDEAGHLIAESQSGIPGSVPRHSYVWLDDRPVALYVHPDSVGNPGIPPLPYATQWLHLHTDHLGTPRAITRPNASNATVWRWDFTGSAFGDHAPVTDPDGDGTHLTFNLRFPGQYYDAESGLHYNMARDYEPGSGRYIETDPVGLRGGVSTYGYAHQRPTTIFDPNGTQSVLVNCAFGFQSPGINCGGIPQPPPPRAPLPPNSSGPSCDGTWELLDDQIFAPGALQYFVCKCRWACFKCDGASTGIVVDTYGQPAGIGGADAKPGRRRGGIASTSYRPTPGYCACTPPEGGKSCKSCEQ